jgi:hypothetical protein
MTNEQINYWLNQAGFDAVGTAPVSKELQAFATLVRNATIDECAELKLDAERLDFIEKSSEGRVLRRRKKRWSFEPVCSSYEYSVFPTLREAIDEAMK